MGRMPFDTQQRKIGSRAVAIVHYKINSEHWEFRQETGSDIGRDCTIELSEDNKWYNHKIEGQIKGTLAPKRLKMSDCFSVQIELKTIRYALGSPISFVLFYVDNNSENVYYLSIQEYFIENKELFNKLFSEQEYLNVRIPIANVLTDEDTKLIEYAKCQYLDGPSKDLHKYRNIIRGE